MAMRINREKEQRRRALAQANRRNARIDALAQSNIDQRAAHSQLGQDRLEFDRAAHTDAMKQKQRQRSHESSMQMKRQGHEKLKQMSQQMHESSIQDKRLRHDSGERGKDRTFEGYENQLNRQTAKDSQGYQRDLDRYRSTPKMIMNPETWQEEPNPAYKTAEKEYLRHFNKRSSGNNYAANILNQSPAQNINNNNITAAGNVVRNSPYLESMESRSSQAGSVNDSYYSPHDNRPMESSQGLRNIAPRQYHDEGQIRQRADGTYTNISNNTFSQNQSRQSRALPTMGQRSSIDQGPSMDAGFSHAVNRENQLRSYNQMLSGHRNY